MRISDLYYFADSKAEKNRAEKIISEVLRGRINQYNIIEKVRFIQNNKSEKVKKSWDKLSRVAYDILSRQTEGLSVEQYKEKRG